MQSRPYEKLVVWQEAHALCLKIYHVTKIFPKDETFALTSQMRRAAYSVPMNIVEGNARASKKEHLHFMEFSRGSLEELHYQCTLAHALGYLQKSDLEQLHSAIGRVGFLLQKLKASLL